MRDAGLPRLRRGVSDRTDRSGRARLASAGALTAHSLLAAAPRRGVPSPRLNAGETDMRMDGQEESSNVEDVRGMSGGGGGGFGFGGRSIGIGSIAVALIAGWIFGINPLHHPRPDERRRRTRRSVQQQQGPAPAPPANDAAARFVSQVLRSTEVVWTDVFRESGRTYQPPKLVLFRGSWPTALRPGPGRDGPVLLPERPEGLHRPALLRPAAQQARRAGPVRAGLRGRPRGRPPRAERSSASWTRSMRCAAAAARRRPTRSACASSCRPTASPASGPSARRRSRAGASSRATSRRR